MRLVPVIARAVYGSKRWKFLTVIFVIAIAKSGIWVLPNLNASAIIASDPFSYHPGMSYLAENWLYAFVGWLLGATTWHTLALVDLVFSIAFVAVMFVLFFRRLSDRSARTASLVFIAMPVSMTAFYWVGLDSLTLLLMGLALLGMRRWWLVAPVGLLLGLQHFEQGIAAALLVAGANGIGILMRQRDWRSLIFPVALGIGLLVGRGLLNLLYTVRGITIDYDRIDWFRDNFGALTRQYLENPLLIWYSILGVAWLAVVRYAMRGRKAAPLLSALGVLGVVTIIYGDHTRVACILALLVVVTEMLLDEEFLTRVTDPEIAVFAVVWLIVPFIWVWGVVVQPSALTFDVELVLHKLFGWFDVPSGDPLLYWPFIIP